MLGLTIMYSRFEMCSFFYIVLEELKKKKLSQCDLKRTKKMKNNLY